MVGAAVSDNLDVPSVIGALGSYIWAISPAVIAKMNINMNEEMKDEEIKKSYDALYLRK